MINLIPPDAKRKITHEYMARLVVCALSISIVLMALTAALKLPSFILLQGQVEAYAAQYTELQSGQATLKEAEALIKETNELARHLVAPAPTHQFSEIIATLDSLTGTQVAINQFELERSGEKVTRILIRGIAANRIALATFSDAVVAHPYFIEANVPIANLAKDQDIDFEITVVPAETL